MASVRRVKWHPPPPPPPRILHFPRRNHRHKPSNKKPRPGSDPFCIRSGHKGHMLDTHFMEEKVVVLLNSARERKRVECRDGGDDVEERESDGEIKWRFQAEMLRAECSLLRTEREIAVRKLEKERGLMENNFQFAVNTLLSGKKKIEEGKNAKLVIEKEIDELAKKMIEFRKSSRMKDTCKVKKCSNLDKQTCLLNKHLEKLRGMGDEVSVKDVKEIFGASSSTSDRIRCGRSDPDRMSNRLVDVETLRRKMEGLSKGKLLKKMEEEYGSMLSVTANSSALSSASTSRNFDIPEFSSFSFRQFPQEAKIGELCSGHCKAIVRRIMEQVRAETEQWSQMQEMLGQVKCEMEELQASRDFWEEQALQSDQKTQALQSEVDEWKGKARCLESKENQLRKQENDLQQEVERLTVVKSCDSEVKANKESTSISLGAQLAREKRPISCRLKERRLSMENQERDLIKYSFEKKEINKNGNRVLITSDRVPFKDVGNVSPLKRQNSRRYVYPLHS